MIAPYRLYRRIEQLEERIRTLPPRLFFDSSYRDPRLDNLPDDERREVLRLIEEAFDSTGHFRWVRLTLEQRTFIHERLRRTDTD